MVDAEGQGYKPQGTMLTGRMRASGPPQTLTRYVRQDGRQRNGDEFWYL